MDKIGLLAGTGRLPVECAKAAGTLGYEVYAVELLPDTDKELAACTADCASIGVARLGDIIAYFKEHGVERVTMLGKVTKELLFNGQHEKPDALMLQLLTSLPDRKDDTLMLTFVQALAQAGLQAFDQTALLRLLLPQPGILTKRLPTSEEKADMDFGLKMAREIGRLDVGQTAVVKGLAVMALEAIEGTDACIRRGGQLACGDAVVAKAAKPNQDLRFDVPAVGLQTIQSMIAAGASALAIEAGRTILVDKEAVIKSADEHNITIAAI